MRIKILSVLLFLTLLLASPAGPGVAQAPEQPAAEEKALKEFIPSEKVPADSAISFPVDI